jgi:hypothetical protein
MKLNFKTTTPQINFTSPNKKVGRPPKKTEKINIMKKIYFKKSEYELLESEYIKHLEQKEDISFSVFLKQLIKKGIQC